MVGRLAAWNARRAIRRALAGARLGPGRLTFGRCLVVGPAGAVIEGRLGDREIVAKWLAGEDGTRLLGALASELTYQHPRMREGPSRVPELLHAADGIVVMERAPGVRMDRAVRERPADRADLVRRAGEWLALYTAPRRVEDAFGGGFWIRSRREALAALPDGPDRDRIEGLVAVMERERDRIGPRPITRARSHGDFTTLNLIVAPDAVWGIDTQNRNWIALAKDIVRFLVWLEISSPAPGGDRRHGIALADQEALLAVDGLIRRGEAELLLPYFLAVELSGRLLTETAYPEIIGNARTLADRMLADG